MKRRAFIGLAKFLPLVGLGALVKTTKTQAALAPGSALPIAPEGIGWQTVQVWVDRREYIFGFNPRRKFIADTYYTIGGGLIGRLTYDLPLQ